MKKYSCIFLATLIALFSITSCKKAETINPTPPQSLGIVDYVLADAYTSNVYPLSPFVCAINKLFLTDSDGRILIYDSDINFIEEFRDANNKIVEGQVLIMNSQGDIYIYNHWNDELEKYDENHNYLKQIDNLPDLDDRTWAFAIGANDDIYVLGTTTIFKYDKELNLISESVDVSTLFNHDTYGFTLEGIACDQLGNVYVTADVDDTAGEGYDAFLKFDNALNYISNKGGNWILNGPRGIAVDEAGVIYVVNRWNSNVKAFDANFDLLQQTAENDDPGTSGGKMMEPYHIWYRNNHLYVTDIEAHNVAIFNKYR